jgi:hypothetical protein
LPQGDTLAFYKTFVNYGCKKFYNIGPCSFICPKKREWRHTYQSTKIREGGKEAEQSEKVPPESSIGIPKAF